MLMTHEDVGDQNNPMAALDLPEYQRWQDTAVSNMRSAQREAEAGAHHVAVFLAEQAAQCAVKAVLHGVGATSRALGHGLATLSEALAVETRQALPAEVHEGMQRLAQAYMPSRYPDALPSGSPSDHFGTVHSAQAIADATTAMAFARHTWEALREAEARATDEPATDDP